MTFDDEVRMAVDSLALLAARVAKAATVAAPPGPWHGVSGKRPHCKRGHRLTPGNIVYKQQPDGTPRRLCRTCHLARQRGYRRQGHAARTAERGDDL
jgi:hypothetical protein